MSSLSGDKPQIPPPGSTSVRFGPAFLRPAAEKDHYELMRPVITVSNEGDRLMKGQHPDPIGPIAVYRTKKRGDKVDMSKASLTGPPQEMRTSDPKTGQPLELILAWWPQMDANGTSEG